MLETADVHVYVEIIIINRICSCYYVMYPFLSLPGKYLETVYHVNDELLTWVIGYRPVRPPGIDNLIKTRSYLISLFVIQRSNTTLVVALYLFSYSSLWRERETECNWFNVTPA